MNDPTITQLEARQFFLYPCRTTLLCVAHLALIAFDEWPDRWEQARVALRAIGLKHTDKDLEDALVKRQNERDAS